MAFGCIGSTTALGRVVRKPYTRCGPGIGFDFVPRSPLNPVQMPANAQSGRSSSSANQTASFFFGVDLAQGHIPRSSSAALSIDSQASTIRRHLVIEPQPR
jgi:hypothetical protein